jgi:hypothetical protein
MHQLFDPGNAGAAARAATQEDLSCASRSSAEPSHAVSAELMLASSTFMQAQICGDRAGMAAGGLAPEDSSRRP